MMSVCGRSLRTPSWEQEHLCPEAASETQAGGRKLSGSTGPSLAPGPSGYRNVRTAVPSLPAVARRCRREVLDRVGIIHLHYT